MSDDAPDTTRTECGFCVAGVYDRVVAGGVAIDKMPCPYCNGAGYVSEEHHGY